MKIDLRLWLSLFLLSGCTRLNIQETSDASSFRAAEACMASSADACVFDKSAVEQAGGSLSAERLGGYQTLGVSLSGTDGSGFLQNSDFSVITANTTRVTSAKGFRHYYDPTGSYAEQAMAYYYLRSAVTWMTARGVFPAAGAGIQVVADSNFNGWVPGKNEIHLERNGTDFPAAFDASVILHLYAQAVISKASSAASHTNLSAKAGSCSDTKAFVSPLGCCTSALGCGPALVSGAADYFVAASFGAGRTRLGAGWKNSTAGLTVCGMSRDPAALLSVSAASAAARCGTGATNHVNALGAVYASIWWKVRTQVSDTKDFDTFFLQHLALIDGADDFSTIKTKLLSLDASTFSSRYSSLLSAEFSRRGL